jgi:ATP-dependent RNA helicase DDX56/DBP9
MSLLDQSETFASLAESIGLDVRLRKAVQRLGHVRPTLVQSKCLPLAVTSGRDLLVRAKTGSGTFDWDFRRSDVSHKRCRKLEIA